MAAETVDTLELEIRSRAADAADGVARLAASVRDFGQVVHGQLASLRDFAETLAKISESVSGLSAIKNLKTVIADATKAAKVTAQMNSAAAAAETAKQKTFKPIIPPLRASDTVKGGTRVVRQANGQVIKFDQSSDALAKDLNRRYELTGSNRRMSEQIQEIRNLFVKGDMEKAISSLKSLSEEITQFAGSKRATGFGAYLNEQFGHGKILVGEDDAKSLVSTFGSLKAVNEILQNAGVTARVTATKGPGRMTFDSLFEGGYQRAAELGMDRFLHLEDIIKEIDSNRTTGHRDFLFMNYRDGEAELREEVAERLLDSVFGAKGISTEKSAEVAEIKQASENAKALVSAFGGTNRVVNFSETKGNALYPVTSEAENASRRAGTREDWNAWRARVDATIESRAARNAELRDREFVNNLKMLTPERIRAEREAQSARALPQWERFRGEDIRHAADEGLKRGFIDESTAQAMKDATTGMREAAQEANNVNEAAQGASEGMNQVKDEANGAAGKMREFGEAEKTASRNGMGLAGSLKNIGHLLGHSIIGQLFRVAKMRALRYAVRAVVSGFKEGIQNMYQWSKQVGGDFATSMDTAASKVMYMKNSLGTALAPVIQALIPVLTTIVNWIHAASNAIAQFFALLNGKNSWTKAVETAEKFGDQQKKNSKKTKDLLADWDELNIIQSKNEDSSGSGTTQYSKMFEEVTEFDEKIKGVTKFIQDNFDKLKEIATEIGAVILGWKLSGTLIAGISQLAGLAVAIGLAKIVFDVSWFTANKYLETKEPGWLVLDFLTPLIGAVFANSILGKVLLGEAATISVPLIFAVSAVADVAANIGKTDVSALSEESLALSFETSLKTAVIGGWIGKMVGGTLMSVVEGGVIGLITGFGIAIGLKADMQVSKEGLTEENVKGEAISTVAMALGGAMTGAAAVKGGLVSGVSTAAASTGMAMLFGGLPIATFGVAIGIEAVNSVVDASSITPELLKKNLISGGLVGAGLTITAASFLGTSTALLVGTGGAAFTIFALISLELMLASKPQKIEWGNLKMTEDQVKLWVEKHMFKADLSMQMTIAGEKAQVTVKNKQALIESTKKALGILPVIKAGMAENDPTYWTELDAAVKQIVADYQTYRGARKEELALAFSIVPIKDKDGNVVTDTYLQGIESGWTAVDEAMTNLGAKLAGLISEAFNKELEPQAREDAMNAVLRYTEEMAKATALITASQAEVKMEHDFGKGLEGVDGSSISAILDYYNEQKSGARQFIEQEYDEIISDSESLLGFYQEAIEEAGNSEDGKFLDKTAAEWKELYDSQTKIYEGLKEARERSVEAALEFYEGDGKGKQMVRDAIMEAVKMKTGQGEASAGISLSPYFKNTGWESSTEVPENEFRTLMEMILVNAYGADSAGWLVNAIDTGIIGWGDLISKETIEQLNKQLELENVSPDLKISFWSLISKYFEGGEGEAAEIKKWADESVEAAKQEVQEALPDEVLEKLFTGLYTRDELVDAYSEDLVKSAELLYKDITGYDAFEETAVDGIVEQIEDQVEEQLEDNTLEVEPVLDVEVKPEYGDVDVELPDEDDEPSGVFHRPVWTEPDSAAKPTQEEIEEEIEDIILTNLAEVWDLDDDTFDERYESLVEEYGENLVDKMALKIMDGLRNGDEYIENLFEFANHGKTGVPGGIMIASAGMSDTRWFQRPEDRNGLVVDTKASGAASEKAVEDLTGTMDGDMAELERLTTEGNRILSSMQTLLRSIAGRDFTVNVAASSGLGRVVERSQKSYVKVTG